MVLIRKMDEMKDLKFNLIPQVSYEITLCPPHMEVPIPVKAIIPQLPPYFLGNTQKIITLQNKSLTLPASLKESFKSMSPIP